MSCEICKTILCRKKIQTSDVLNELNLLFMQYFCVPKLPQQMFTVFNNSKNV